MSWMNYGTELSLCFDVQCFLSCPNTLLARTVVCSALDHCMSSAELAEWPPSIVNIFHRRGEVASITSCFCKHLNVLVRSSSRGLESCLQEHLRLSMETTTWCFLKRCSCPRWRRLWVSMWTKSFASMLPIIFLRFRGGAAACLSISPILSLSQRWLLAACHGRFWRWPWWRPEGRWYSASHSGHDRWYRRGGSLSGVSDGMPFVSNSAILRSSVPKSFPQRASCLRNSLLTSTATNTGFCSNDMSNHGWCLRKHSRLHRLARSVNTEVHHV